MATITTDQLSDLSDYLADNSNADFHEDDDLGVFRTYSGRGMYGRECVGLVISNSEMFEVAMVVGQWLTDNVVDYDLSDAFKNARTDSMGRSMIVYWPSIAIEAAGPDDEADEMDRIIDPSGNIV